MTAKSDGLLTVTGTHGPWKSSSVGCPFFAGLIKPPCPSLYCVVMIQSWFSLRYALWITVFVTVSHATVLDESLFAQQTQPPPPITSTAQSPTAAPVSQSPLSTAGQTPSSELGNVEAKVLKPSVIWMTTFDSKGNLLRTESGFFISADGRFVTTAHAVEGGVNAVAKTADGGIYNVGGVLTVSKSADLAVLKADVKPQKLLRFLDLTKTGELSTGAKVAVVGSSLAGNEGSARETTITAHSSDRLEIAGATAASSVGVPRPVVNEKRRRRWHRLNIGLEEENDCASWAPLKLHSVSSSSQAEDQDPAPRNEPNTARDALAAIVFVLWPVPLHSCSGQALPGQS